MPILSAIASATARALGFGLLTPGGGGPYTVIQTFTSSTTWVCPAGVTEVEYLVVAGGGSGGSGFGETGQGGGGGGGC